MATDNDLQVTKGEKHFYSFMTGNADKFYDSLFNTILTATAKQKKMLGKAFPEEVAAVEFYQNVEGYWKQLKIRIESQV